MSERIGDTARFNREAKKHRLHRQRNRELRKTLPGQAAAPELSPPTEDPQPVISKSFATSPGAREIASTEDGPSREIILNDAPSGGYND